MGGETQKTSVRGAHSAHVAGVAEEMGVQGEALRAGLIRQLLAALLERENLVRTRRVGEGARADRDGPPTSQW